MKNFLLASPDNLPHNLAQKGVFAILIALTTKGEVVSRPIGGPWDSGITEAIRELDEAYPGCKMKLFERSYDARRRYFEGEISRDRLL